VRRLELPSLSRRDAAAIPPGNEASHRMFFELTLGSSLRTSDESRRAFDLDQPFDNALHNTAVAWRHAVDRRLRRPERKSMLTS